MYKLHKEKFTKLKKTVQKKLGMKRNLTSYEEEYLTKWAEEYGYDISIIELALKRSSSMNSISFEYFDKILTEWHNNALSTVSDVENYQNSKKEKAKKSTSKHMERKIPEFSYTQSTFDNLESLYDN